MLTHKLNFWRYEEEVRFLLYDGVETDIGIGELKSITFGLKFIEDLSNKNNLDNQDKNLIKIDREIRIFKKNKPNFELYTINNIQPDGNFIRTLTQHFG